MKDLEARLERLIRLTAPDTLTLQLEDGQTVELTYQGRRVGCPYGALFCVAGA